jgi:hypothetical protein
MQYFHGVNAENKWLIYCFFELNLHDDKGLLRSSCQSVYAKLFLYDCTVSAPVEHNTKNKSIAIVFLMVDSDRQPPTP